MEDHSLDVVLGQANLADEATVEVLDATLLALGLGYLEQCREVNNELGQLSGRNHRKDSDDTAWWETNSEADSEGMSSEAVTDDECAGNSKKPLQALLCTRPFYGWVGLQSRGTGKPCLFASSGCNRRI